MFFGQKSVYRISSYSCRGNYSFFEFIKVWKFHIVSSLSFPLCNENLNSFLTRWKRGNYSREETIGGNTVFWFCLDFSETFTNKNRNGIEKLSFPSNECDMIQWLQKTFQKQYWIHPGEYFEAWLFFVKLTIV